MELTIAVKTIYLLLVIFSTSYVVSAYTPIAIDIVKSPQMKIFTEEEIGNYDGSQEEEPIYMAIKGVVFDVTSGKSFYGKQSPYNAMAGKDVSQSVAKMSLDPTDLNSDISSLTDEQLQSLDDTYEQTYKTKYPIVGYMSYLIDQQTAREATKEDL